MLLLHQMAHVVALLLWGAPAAALPAGMAQPTVPSSSSYC
ncbi:hypothetical protein [Nonomuraea basaltis]